MPETGGWLQVGGAPGAGVGEAEPQQLFSDPLTVLEDCSAVH